jgi:hypothetical protein
MRCIISDFHPSGHAQGHLIDPDLPGGFLAEVIKNSLTLPVLCVDAGVFLLRQPPEECSPGADCGLGAWLRGEKIYSEIELQL